MLSGGALLDLLDRGDVRDAVAVAEGDGVPARIVAAWRSAGEGDPAGAVRALRPLVAALEGDPASRREHAHAVLALGVASVLAGEGEPGTALLERALTLHAEDWPRAQCLRFCALALEQRGAWEGAAARYVAAAAAYRAIGHPHGGGSALYGAATALSEVGQDKRALELLEEAVVHLRRAGRNPALGAALGQLAALRVEHDAAAALATLEEAEALCRDAPGMYAWDVRLRRAEILLRLDRPEEAIPTLWEARGLIPAGIPDAVWVDHLLARAFLQLGRVPEAVELLAESERARRGPPSLPGAASIERAALRLLVAARAPRHAFDAIDGALDLLERGVRARWHRRGVERLVMEAAQRLATDARGERSLAGARSGPARRSEASAEGSWGRGASGGGVRPSPREDNAGAWRRSHTLAGASRPGLDRAARAWQLAVALGHGTDRGPLRALRVAGARIPLGPLWLEARIGSGGMGDVWRATHRQGGRVAVKIVRNHDGDPRGELFFAEMQAVARLDHPNVVRVLAVLPLDPVSTTMLEAEVSVAAHGYALVMELVEGGSLAEHLEGWRWPDVEALLRSLLSAVGHAHARGVLHLDLKPANVLLDASRTPRLTDFGLAGLARGRDESRVFGTPAYMAPEQGVPGAPLGPGADLYALGCLAWRLLTGRVPFPAATVLEQLAMHRSAALPAFEPLCAVPAGLEGWLRTMLAKRTDRRFASAADAAAALSRLDEAGSVDGISAAPLDAGDRGGATLAPAAGTLYPERFASGPQTTAWIPPPDISGMLVEDRPRARPTPFCADWRVADQRSDPIFLPGVGEGLFAWRVGRLVGRERERDALWTALGLVHADGAGRAIWITGGPGLGRTALLGWLAETARITGAASVPGPFDAPLDDRPRLVLLDDPDPGEAERVLEREARGVLVVVAARAPAPAGVPSLVLDPLDDAAIRTLLDDRLPLDRELAAVLAARAAGSPAFAVALLTDLVRRDALEPGPEGFRPRPDAAVTLPEDLRALWSARLDTLAPPGSPRRSAWEIAAIAGADRETVAAACRRAGILPDVETHAPLLAEGWAKLVEGALVFVVPAVAEALRASAAASGRAATWHALLADVSPPEAPMRARHLAGAGRHAEALRPLRRAAADAVNATRLAECRELLELWDRSADALGLAPDDPQRAWPIVVRVHLSLHTRDDPYALLERGLAVAQGETAAQLAYTHGWVLAQDGRHAEAEVAFARAIALAGQLALDELRHVSLLGLAASRYALGRDADPLVAALRPLLADRADLRVRLDLCEGRGRLRLGRAARAAELLHAAAVEARRLDLPEVAADAWVELAEACATLADPAGAIGALTEALAVLAPTGSDKALGVRIRLAAALAGAGREAEARALVDHARRFGWRLRPDETAALTVVIAALDGATSP